MKKLVLVLACLFSVNAYAELTEQVNANTNGRVGNTTRITTLEADVAQLQADVAAIQPVDLTDILARLDALEAANSTPARDIIEYIRDPNIDREEYIDLNSGQYFWVGGVQSTSNGGCAQPWYRYNTSPSEYRFCFAFELNAPDADWVIIEAGFQTFDAAEAALKAYLGIQ